MKKFTLLAVIIVAPLIGAMQAQPPERPKNQDAGDTPKPTADPAEAGAPAKEHRWLKQLVGEWKVTGKMFLAPGQPPIESAGTEKVRVLGDYWVVTEGQATIMDTPLHSLMTLGFDAAKGKFVGTWIDSSNGYMWHFEGTLDAEGKVLTLIAEGPSMDDPSKQTKYRDVIEIKNKNHRVMTSSVLKADGTWHTFGSADKKRAE
jgi:hypothetical protein